MPSNRDECHVMSDDQTARDCATPTSMLRSGRAWRRVVFWRETPKLRYMALNTFLVAWCIANFAIGDTQFERLFFGFLGVSALPMWAAMVYQRVHDKRTT